MKGETPYAEWYWHSLTEGKKAKAPGDGGYHTWQFHRRVYGPNFEYQDFARLFRAELFDPDRWADVFSRSGARYVALTSKHHEGFTLWRSAEANRSWGRPWNAVDIGPRRDLLAELTEAGRRRGLHMGIYYSLYEWYNPLWLSDRARYVTEHMMPQFNLVVSVRMAAFVTPPPFSAGSAAPNPLESLALGTQVGLSEQPSVYHNPDLSAPAGNFQAMLVTSCERGISTQCAILVKGISSMMRSPA